MDSILYLEGRCTLGKLYVTTSSFMALFTLKCCENLSVNVVIVDLGTIKDVVLHEIKFEFHLEIKPIKDCPSMVQNCKLPATEISGQLWCTSGLSSAVRQILHYKVSEDGDQLAKKLLGFRSSCLQACAEVSVWTKFCEIEVSEMVDKWIEMKPTNSRIIIPKELIRFENHLKCPTITHNILKQKQEHLGKNLTKEELVQLKKKKLHELPNLEHNFAEGLLLTLADLFIFSTFSFIFMSPNINDFVQKNLPLTAKWYDRIKHEKYIQNTIPILNLCENKILQTSFEKKSFVLPEVLQESLYKADPERYKSRWRAFTNQKDIEESTKKLQSLTFKETVLNIDNFNKENNDIVKKMNSICIKSEQLEYESITPTDRKIVISEKAQIIQVTKFKFNDEFGWEKLPKNVNLHDQLPKKRLDRKQQQLENMVMSVLTIAKPGNVIVDFCCGSGHLGILLAYYLPDCKVLLVDNKEESLKRAFRRIASLGLKNIEFYQCNLDYFTGLFDIGVCLHACGVATDLVIKKCVDRTASFVCSPCCYGSIQSNHILQYPRSLFYLKTFNVSAKNYYILSHAADQTHDEENCKTIQGRQCMRLVDNDRLSYAKEMGYETTLALMNPPSCTPKNHILIGLFGKS